MPVTRPTSDPLTATDSVYNAIGTAHHGLPTRVDMGPAARAQGFSPGVLPSAFLSERIGVLGDWTEWQTQEIDAHETRLDASEAYLRPDLGASRGVYLYAIQGASGWDATDSRPGWAPTINGVSSQGTGKAPFHWSVMGGGVMPSACTITAARVFLKPGAARSGTNRTRVRAYRIPASGLVPVLVGDVYSDTTSNLQIVDVTGLSIALNNDDSSVYGLTNIGFVIRVDPGNDASADSAYICEIRHSATIR